MKKTYSNKLHILIFLLPALILFCGVLIAPIGASLYYSFFNWKGIGPKTFIAFANYKELFTSNSIGFRWPWPWRSRWARRSRARGCSSRSTSCRS